MAEYPPEAGAPLGPGAALSGEVEVGPPGAEAGITWNYITILNIIFLLLAAALLIRFFRSGGRPMLTMMGGAPGEASAP